MKNAMHSLQLHDTGLPATAAESQNPPLSRLKRQDPFGLSMAIIMAIRELDLFFRQENPLTEEHLAMMAEATLASYWHLTMDEIFHICRMAKQGAPGYTRPLRSRFDPEDWMGWLAQYDTGDRARHIEERNKRLKDENLKQLGEWEKTKLLAMAPQGKNGNPDESDPRMQQYRRFCKRNPELETTYTQWYGAMLAAKTDSRPLAELVRAQQAVEQHEKAKKADEEYTRFRAAYLAQKAAMGSKDAEVNQVNG